LKLKDVVRPDLDSWQQ